MHRPPRRPFRPGRTRPLSVPNWTAAAALAEGLAAPWAGAPGGAFVLFDRSGLRATASAGLASLEHGIAFTPDTPSRYASISKHILATALLLTGIDLDAQLGAFLPDLPAALAAVPLAQGLGMTGGLPDMMEVLWQIGTPFTATLSAEEIKAALSRLDAVCSAPGIEMAYSNTGWRLGQAVLEARLGMPYAQALQSMLMSPLGLPIQFPYDEAEPVPGLATGYWLDKDAWRRGRYGMHISASGGLTGSATALARWAAALMAGQGPLHGILDRLLAPRHFADGALSSYRLGLVATRVGDMELVAHSGSLPGYRNHLLMAPAHGVGVVLLLNRDEDPLLPALRVMAALLDQELPQPAALAPGLYAEATGPTWADVAPGGISFMGGHETLLATRDGTARSIPSTLEIDLRHDGQAIEGRIGGVHRRLLPVPGNLSLDPALVGQWREQTFGARLLIRADGTALWPWAGSLGRETVLTPLPGTRALASLNHAMWRHRPCLFLDPDGALRVASHRARVLRFLRVAPADLILSPNSSTE